jgi:hypothetical protein
MLQVIFQICVIMHYVWEGESYSPSVINFVILRTLHQMPAKFYWCAAI